MSCSTSDDGQSSLPPPVLMRGLVVLWATLWTLNALRALRFPHPFALGHWLFNYRYGFVKRGLPGTLLEPWIVGKTSEEIQTVVDGVGLTIYLVSAYLTLAWASRVLSRTRLSHAWYMGATGITVFVLSPYIVSQANLVGYFDQPLVIGCIASVALIGHGSVVLTGVIAAICVLTHEMFLLFGLPVLCFALWLHRADRGYPNGVRGELGVWTALLLPAALAALVIVHSEATGAAIPRANALSANVERLHVITPLWLATAFYPLRINVAKSLSDQLPSFWQLLASADSFEVIHPTTVALTLLALWVLWACRRRSGRGFLFEAVALIAVVLVPYLIGAFGWDWQRFFVMGHFHALAVLLIVLSSRRYSLETRANKAVWTGALGVSALAIVTSVRGDIAIAAPGGVERAFVLRKPDAYVCSRPLFPNSNFALGTFENWQVFRLAFRGQPLVADTPALRDTPAEPRGYWVGSYEGSCVEPQIVRNPRGNPRRCTSAPFVRRLEGDRYRGTLRSRSFVIEDDTVVFRVGGGCDIGHVYIRLLVDGNEVLRTTGLCEERMAPRAWSVERYRQRSAVIEIVDDSSDSWGHINAEGFCYRP